jgi:hypothetical protein
MAQDMYLKHFHCESVFVFANCTPHVFKIDKLGIIPRRHDESLGGYQEAGGTGSCRGAIGRHSGQQPADRITQKPEKTDIFE